MAYAGFFIVGLLVWSIIRQCNKKPSDFHRDAVSGSMSAYGRWLEEEAARKRGFNRLSDYQAWRDNKRSRKS